VKSKKILFRLWQFPHLSETFITAQIITAIQCDYDVSILVQELLDIDSSKQIRRLNTYKIFDKIILEKTVIPKNKVVRLFKAFKLVISSPKDFLKLIRYVFSFRTFSLSWIYSYFYYKKFTEYDIIHVQYGTNKGPFDILKKVGFNKFKLIVSFHGHDAFFPINGRIQNNGYYDVLFKYVDYIIANTNYLKDAIINLGCSENKIRTIPVSVDIDYFYPKGNDIKQGNKLISVGRLDPVKGHQYLIKVLKILVDKDKDVSLSIVGEGAERSNLEQLIDDLNLNSRVFLMGKRSQKEILTFLQESDIYVLASVPVQNERRETQGLATLEAQACGLPVVAFDSGGVTYTVDKGKSGFLVGEYNIQDMAAKIQYLLEYNDECMAMGKHARKFVSENFSKEVLDQKWFELYSELSS